MRASARRSRALCSHFEKQLDRSQIAGLAVDLRRLGAAHRVRAILAAVHPGALDPTVHDSCVLARRGASTCGARFQPVLQRGAGLLRDLKLNRTASLVLDDCRPVPHMTAHGDVTDQQADEIAATKLAVDGEVEYRQMAFVSLDLKWDTNGPDLFRPQKTLLSDKTALVPRRT